MGHDQNSRTFLWIWYCDFVFHQNNSKIGLIFRNDFVLQLSMVLRSVLLAIFDIFNQIWPYFVVLLELFFYSAFSKIIKILTM